MQLKKEKRAKVYIGRGWEGLCVVIDRASMRWWSRLVDHLMVDHLVR